MFVPGYLPILRALVVRRIVGFALRFNTSLRPTTEFSRPSGGSNYYAHWGTNVTIGAQVMCVCTVAYDLIEKAETPGLADFSIHAALMYSQNLVRR